MRKNAGIENRTLWSGTRIAIPICIIAAAAGMAVAQENGLYRRVAVLMPQQEVPPSNSSAIGAANLLIDTCANTATYRITHSCLSSAETAAHIHGVSAPGVNSGVLHPLPAGSPKTGVWTYPEALENDLLSGRMYINIHSVNFPGGEIRGQIVSAVAVIDTAQEVPPPPAGGAGFGLINIDTNTDTLSYYILYGGLASAETAAHIHGPAIHGVNAGVVHALPAANPKVGSWNYPAALESAIVDGQMYINIHTATSPGGETRGQICTYVNMIDGTQEVPPNGSPASGFGLFSLNRGTDTLGVDVRHCGLVAAETAAHIHGFAPAGVNAGVLLGLPAGPRKLASWVFGAANEANVENELTYVNIHSATFPGGEIRGQIRIDPLVRLCPGDFDVDGSIGLPDLARLLSSFGGPADACTGDMNGDGIVDLVDLAAFLALFGSTC